MKKLKQIVGKMDTLAIMLGGLFFLVFIYTQETDLALKIINTMIVIPLFTTLVYNAMEKKQENNFHNIDLYMKEKVNGKMVWKLRTDNSIEDRVYLCIRNIGKIDIFSMYIKVLTNDGAVGWYRVPEMLNVNDECVVCVPYKKENLNEVIITCDLQTESRTKKFNGIQSGNQDMTIFSNIEMFEKERYAIYHEKGFDVFDKMERFWV